LKHAQTCFYYDQVAWLPISRPIKPHRERHGHNTYIEGGWDRVLMIFLDPRDRK